MRASANVSAIEQHIIAESLRRVACVRPEVALVRAEALEAEDERDLSRLAAVLTPEEARFALNLVADVIAKTGGEA